MTGSDAAGVRNRLLFAKQFRPTASTARLDAGDHRIDTRYSADLDAKDRIHGLQS